jgi:AcrR family transcriptional regulator
MNARRAAKDAVRQRIVDATMALHLEKGVVGTSFEDIARKADVAVATVYRHFPTLDELVDGCGARVMEVIRPPIAEAASLLFDGATSTSERVRRLVGEFVAFYGRAVKAFVLALRDADHVPGRRHFMDAQRATLEAFVREALRETRAGERTGRVVAALLDFGTWKAMADRGLRPQDVQDVLVTLVLCQLERGAAA